MFPCAARLFYIYIFLAQEWTLKHFIRVFFFYWIRGPPHSLSFHRSRALPSLLGAMRLPAPVHWANLALLFIPRHCHHTCIWKKDIIQHLLSSLTILASVSLRHLPSLLMQCAKIAGNPYQEDQSIMFIQLFAWLDHIYKERGWMTSFCQISHEIQNHHPKSYSLRTWTTIKDQERKKKEQKKKFDY